MFVIPAIVISIIFLLLKILVPSIIIISLIVLLYIYYKKRKTGDGDQWEEVNINLNSVKEKATNYWEKIKFASNFFFKVKKIMKRKDKN